MAKLPIRRILGVLGACLLSAVLLRLSFPVPGLFPLAWVALVPWFVVVREQRGGMVFLGSAVMGLAAAGLGLSWQFLVTVAGGSGLALYVGFYFPLFAWGVRDATRRLRVPFVVAAPLVWVGGEYLRSFVITGFPWYYVGHSQRSFLALVQVADLFGAYAVSFVVVAANAFVADLVVARRAGTLRWRRAAAGGGFVAALVAATLAYGFARLATFESREGPRVGIVQGNVPQDIKNLQTIESIAEIFRDHQRLTLGLPRGSDGPPLDLALWPETMVQMPLNRTEYATVREIRTRLAVLSRELGSPLLIGAYTEYGDDRTIAAEADGVVRRVADDEIAMDDRVYLLPRPTTDTPGPKPVRRILVREGQQVRRGDVLAEFQSIVLNSAYLFRADTPPERPTDLAFRYDKNHLVPFGEYVPLKEWLGFLGQVVPFPKGFTPGPRPNLMEAGGRRFGILICFEDAFPRLVRRYVNRPEGQGAEFLVNISNDGWFRGSHELDQHWSLCVFRAIEFRIGIVRSVNSGISGIIHPTGRVQARVTDARGRFKLVEGTAVGRVHLREGLTVYARIGDVFALVCLLFGALALAAGIVMPIAGRLRRRAG